MTEEYEDDMISLPEISPFELAEWLKNQPDLVVLDVREPYEFGRARLQDPRVVYAPLSELARKYLDALPDAAQDKTASVAVICHHGSRSAQVTAWLLDQGWQHVVNVSGGIDAYARQVDPAVGLY